MYFFNICFYLSKIQHNHLFPGHAIFKLDQKCKNSSTSKTTQKPNQSNPSNRGLHKASPNTPGQLVSSLISFCLDIATASLIPQCSSEILIFPDLSTHIWGLLCQSFSASRMKQPGSAFFQKKITMVIVGLKSEQIIKAYYCILM